MVVLQRRFAAMGIVVMSLLDATFTLNVLRLGGSEVNPIMAYLIGLGTVWFFAGKMTLTGMGVWLLVRASDHPQHRGPSALTLLRLCFFGYATLMAWHLILVGRLT